MQIGVSRERVMTGVIALALFLTAVMVFPAAAHDEADADKEWIYEGGEASLDLQNNSGSVTLESPEIQLLVDRHDVSPELAMEMLTWLNEAEQAIIQTRTRNADTYAGSEFVHGKGSIELRVWMTRDGEEAVSALVDTLRMPEFAAVVAREAPLSERELVAEAPRLVEAESDSLGQFGSLDFRTGRYVPSESQDYVRDSHDVCTHGTGGWLEGGRLLRIATNGEYHYDQSDSCTPASSTCTSGFTAYISGKQGILTAGHCLEGYSQGYRNVTLMYANNRELFVSLRSYQWDSLPDDDAGFANEVYGSSDPRGRIYLGPAYGWRNITNLLPYAAPTDAIRCIKSASPNDIGTPPNHNLGYRCGWVTSGNFCHWYGLYCRYTEVENSGWNDFPEGGSSGGPWFTSSSAAGVHSFSSTDKGVYYRLDHAKSTLPGLKIYCGGTSQYLCSWP